MKFNHLITTIVVLGIATSSFGQIGWWPFNGNADDESGNGNHGTSMGATLTTDRFGNDSSAYQFDGNDYITIPSSPSLESPTTRFSVSVWVYIDSLGGSLKPIIMKSSSGSNSFMYRLYVWNTTGYASGTNDWNQNIGVSYPFEFEEWYMLTAVHDSSMTYHYVNDSLIAIQTYTTNIQSDTNPLEIGRDTPGATEYYQGKIDDIGLWEYALDSVEVAALYTPGTVSGIFEQHYPSILHVYPNPTNGQVYINGITNERVLVFNALGKQLMTLRAKNTIDLTSFSDGLYYIQVVSDTGQILSNTKVLKE